MAKITFAKAFPFCIKRITDSTLVGAGTTYPIGLTRAEMFSLVWKTKTLSVSSKEEFTADVTSNPDFPIQDFQGIKTLNGQINEDTHSVTIANNPQETEKSLICRSEFNYRHGALNLQVSNCYEYEDLYYPYLVINATGQSSIQPRDDYGNPAIVNNHRNLAGYTDADVTISGTCTVNLFGDKTNDIELYEYPAVGVYGRGASEDFFGVVFGYTVFYSAPAYFTDVYYTSVSIGVTSTIEVTVEDTWQYQ